MARTFLSYEDLRRTGVLSSEATALQYCLDVELLRPNHFCPECQTYMELRSCASTKYSDGYCWSCPGGQHHLSVRARSILYNRNITFINFLHLLWIFVNGTSVAGAARILDMNEKTVRSFYKAIRQCMVEDLLVCPRCAPGVPEIVPQVCPRCASADYRVTLLLIKCSL